MPVMITNICLFNKRNNIILKYLKECISEKRKTLILSDRREHLKVLKKRIEEDGKSLLQAYVLPMMQSRDNMLSKISGSTNALTLKGRFSEDISITGKGEGAFPPLPLLFLISSGLPEMRHRFHGLQSSNR